LDGDRRLGTVGRNCGVILDLPPDADEATCPQCRARNVIRQRGDARITASLAGG